MNKLQVACEEHSLQLSTMNWKVFQKEGNWIGRNIDQNGYQLDLQNINPIRNIEFQTTDDEIGRFVHGCIWMSSCVPSFHSLSHRLSDILESAHAKCGKRGKRHWRRSKFITVPGVWHTKILPKAQGKLEGWSGANLPKRKPRNYGVYGRVAQVLAGIFTQVNQLEPRKYVGHQKQQPFSLLGGRFSRTQENRTRC